MPTKDELQADLDEALHKLDLAEKREARLKDKMAEAKEDAPAEESEAPEASLDAIEEMADALFADASNGVKPHLMAVKGAVSGARSAQSAEAAMVRP